MNRNITSALNNQDLSILLFAFIYLAEFSTIPSLLFDPCQEIPSKIVKKTSLYMTWADGAKKTKLNESTLDSLLKQALVRLKGRELDVDNCINCAYIDKEIVLGRLETAKSFVDLKLRLNPQSVVLWKYMKRICRMKKENFQIQLMDLKPSSSEVTFFLAAAIDDGEYAFNLLKDYPKKILRDSSVDGTNIAGLCYL